MLNRPMDLHKRFILIGMVICLAALTYFAVSTELWRYGFGTSERYLNAPWEKRESRHFVFRYFARTAADYHLDSIIADEEKAYDAVVAALGTAPQEKIDCYLYPSVSELYRWTRMSRPFAQGTMIHLIYSSFGTVDAHEVTHAVARSLGRPSRFLQEGLAVSMEQNVAGDPLSFWMEEITGWGIGDGFVAREYGQFDSKLDARGYAIAGAFVTYLRDTYGQDKFLQLYASDNYDVDLAAFEKNIARVYGVGLDRLNSDFTEWLKQAGQPQGK